MSTQYRRAEAIFMIPMLRPPLSALLLLISRRGAEDRIDQSWISIVYLGRTLPDLDLWQPQFEFRKMVS